MPLSPSGTTLSVLTPATVSALPVEPVLTLWNLSYQDSRSRITAASHGGRTLTAEEFGLSFKDFLRALGGPRPIPTPSIPLPYSCTGVSQVWEAGRRAEMGRVTTLAGRYVGVGYSCVTVGALRPLEVPLSPLSAPPPMDRWLSTPRVGGSPAFHVKSLGILRLDCLGTVPAD